MFSFDSFFFFDACKNKFKIKSNTYIWWLNERWWYLLVIPIEPRCVITTTSCLYSWPWARICYHISVNKININENEWGSWFLFIKWGFCGLKASVASVCHSHKHNNLKYKQNSNYNCDYKYFLLLLLLIIITYRFSD